MSMLLDDARFLFTRTASNLRRMLASARTRGIGPTARRALERLSGRLTRAATVTPLWLPASEPLAPFAVPFSERPRASIVIAVDEQLQMAVDCLRALAAQPPQLPVEIIVVDCAPRANEQALAKIQALRYQTAPHDGGPSAAGNAGAALAHGQFLVFLDSHTLPQPGWLDALLATFAIHPDTGLAGAQLVYADGRLRQAGITMLADGSSVENGHLQAPADPRYSYARQVDAVCAAAFAVPRTLFASLDGLDPRYPSVDEAVTDAAFAIRAAGLKVRYQPAAVVVQREATTVSDGIKADPARALLTRKWHDVLALQPAHPHTLSAGRHAQQRQVLVIDSVTPKPDRDSASLRLVNLMSLLQEEGAHVCFLPADATFVAHYTPALQAQGIEVWYGPFIKGLPRFLQEHGHRFASVLLCRHYVADALVPLVRRYAPQARLVFDTVDLHYLRERRGAQMEGEPLLLKQSYATQASELAVMKAADLTLVVSAAERAELAREVPQVQVEILSNLLRPALAATPFQARSGLLFVGGFLHPPNLAAVTWFVEEVFAQIQVQLPEVVFHIVGVAPPPQIQRLAGRPGVRVHGHVPDLLPLLESSRISLAPLRYGAGVKGKINQAMAHGLPVVATTVAAEGMHLRDGQDVLLADTSQAFADAVVRLYSDPALWHTLATHGLENVRQHFSLDAARATVRSVFFDRTVA